MNMLEHITISSMNLQDVQNLKEHLTEMFDDFWKYQIFFEEIVNTTSSYLVAKLDDSFPHLTEKTHIVGFAGFKPIIDEANIMNVVVRKDMRNLGIATKLLEALCKVCVEKGCTSITLEVNENNLPAIGLYKKQNFQIIGKRKKYYHGTDDAILMTKTLT